MSRPFLKSVVDSRSEKGRTSVLQLLEKCINRRTEPTGIEPSVAPRAPSVTAHLLQGCYSRYKHLQTQALLPEAVPIHHLSPSHLHTHNVVPGLIHRIEV